MKALEWGIPLGPIFAGILAAMFAVNTAMIVSAATGGYIKGAGTGTSDSINAKLSNGEYVINAKQTSKFLPLLEAINEGKLSGLSPSDSGGGIPNFASGGHIGSNRVPIPPTVRSGEGGATPVYNTTNINISGNVDQRSIDQIKRIIKTSPKEVEQSNSIGTRNKKGLRRPAGR
jgi:hypothetical protein